MYYFSLSLFSTNVCSRSFTGVVFVFFWHGKSSLVPELLLGTDKCLHHVIFTQVLFDMRYLKNSFASLDLL